MRRTVAGNASPRASTTVRDRARVRVCLIAIAMACVGAVAGLDAAASAATGDVVRVHAGAGTFRDAAGRLWRPAGTAMNDRRVRLPGAFDTTSTPRL